MSDEASRPGLDPYHAAYLFRRSLESPSEHGAPQPEAVHQMFEALEEADALELVARARPRVATGDLEDLALVLSRRDSRPCLRAAWIQALGETTGGEGVRRGILEALRRDPSPRVQATCLTVLGKLQESLALPLLRPFLTHRDARVRANATDLLVERDMEGSEEVLEVLQNDPSARVAATASLALWRRGNRNLVRYLGKEEVPAARLAFLHACSRAGRDRRLRELVEEAVERGTPEERRVAARSLAAVSPAGRIPELVDWALRGQDHEVRQSLLRGCEESDRIATLAALKAVLRADPSGQPGRERYLANALSALREMGEVNDLALVGPLLEADDPRVRANAIELVEDRIEVQALVPALEKSFREGAPREHANAAVALWRRGSVEAMSRLVREVDTIESRVAPSAAFGLGRMGGTIAESALARALRRGAGATRRIAFRFLSKAA